MRLKTVLDNLHQTRESGFTAVEILITFIVFSVLAAISIPNFVGWYNKYKLAENLEDVRVTLEEARLKAEKQGTKAGCTLNFNLPNQITSSDAGCLTSGTLTLSQGIAMVAEENPGNALNNLTFSFYGSTNKEGTIVLYRTDGSGEKRCLAITLITGIMRTGIYEDSTTPPTNIDKSKCKPEKQV